MLTHVADSTTDTDDCHNVTDVNGANDDRNAYFCKVYHEKTAPFAWIVKMTIVKRLNVLNKVFINIYSMLHLIEFSF